MSIACIECKKLNFFQHLSYILSRNRKKVLSPFLLTTSLVFAILSLNPSHSRFCFYMWNFFPSSTADSVIKARSSAYHISFGQLVVDSSFMAWRTMRTKSELTALLNPFFYVIFITVFMANSPPTSNTTAHDLYSSNEPLFCS